MRSVMKKIYIALIILFLYAPIGTLIVLSFNASKTRAKWGGFTFNWYVSLFQNEEILRALFNTLFIAFVSSLTATVIGTVACIAMTAMKRRTKAILMGITNIPMLNADIVTGISLMSLYISLGIRFGMGTILLSHITFNIPYVILSVMPRVRQLNVSTYEAALDLGASNLNAFFKVVFPDLSASASCPASSWLSPCPWTISLLHTLPKALAWILFPLKYIRKSKRESSPKCTPFPLSFL